MPLPLLLGLAAAAAGAGAIKKNIEKAKATNELLEEAEAKCRKEALIPKVPRSQNEFQSKMYENLFEHAFSSDDKNAVPPISSDWKHLPDHIQAKAAKKYSLLSWGEYSFYTFEGVYYHNKKKGIHEFLYYDCINAYDSTTNIVDYGNDHQKRDISNWDSFDKQFVRRISRIWELEEPTDTSVLEFCFNFCSEFKAELSFFKDTAISNIFKLKSERLNMPSTLQQNFRHIQITNMKDGNLELQYWVYFPKVENVIFNENDSEDDIREKEWEQKLREYEAEEKQWKAQDSFEKLLTITDDIATLFQQSLYELYGVLFKKENITFLEEPNFTYEGPSFLDKVEGVANRAQGAYDKLADITQRRMDEVKRDYERKNQN